jgi:DNA relaxase NicK
LDLQTTIWTSDRVLSIGPESYESADKWNRWASGAVKRKVNRINGNDGGWTTYIGAKGSNHFCRLYDKNAESKDERYTNAWRYEVQVQNTSADKVSAALARSTGTLEWTIASTVRQYFVERGVIPHYTSDMASLVVPSQEVPQTDVARMLMWLEKQVAPTVAKLRKLGYTDEVAELFGLLEASGAEPGAHD